MAKSAARQWVWDRLPAPRAWRVFRFRRTAASRISRAPRSRPCGSSRSSCGKAPQPSRSIRTHHNAHCEPRRFAAASRFSYRRPDCAAVLGSSIRTAFRPTRSKRPQACYAATAGRRRLHSRTCRGPTLSSVGLSDMPRPDAIVCGSVAVTRDGRRCGKGEGYSDLEFAILRELGHPPVPVATTVHDLQVVDAWSIRRPTTRPGMALPLAWLGRIHRRRCPISRTP
jgi:hypothetical protein